MPPKKLPENVAAVENRIRFAKSEFERVVTAFRMGGKADNATLVSVADALEDAASRTRAVAKGK